MQIPLMPKATAVWLVDNTTLSFDQIAEFCGLHTLEVQGIADGEVAANIQGSDPVINGQLTRSEIERCEKDPAARLNLKKPDVEMRKQSKGPRYTPVSKRQDKPDAIAWIVRYHPEVADSLIVKLIGTTKDTIRAIRDKSHWNISNINPRDPVSLGLCKQYELDEVIRKAAEQQEKRAAKAAAAETAKLEKPETEAPAKES